MKSQNNKDMAKDYYYDEDGTKINIPNHFCIPTEKEVQELLNSQPRSQSDDAPEPKVDRTPMNHMDLQRQKKVTHREYLLTFGI